MLQISLPILPLSVFGPLNSPSIRRKNLCQNISIPCLRHMILCKGRFNLSSSLACTPLCCPEFLLQVSEPISSTVSSQSCLMSTSCNFSAKASPVRSSSPNLRVKMYVSGKKKITGQCSSRSCRWTNVSASLLSLVLFFPSFPC